VIFSKHPFSPSTYRRDLFRLSVALLGEKRAFRIFGMRPRKPPFPELTPYVKREMIKFLRQRRRALPRRQPADGPGPMPGKNETALQF
jgi:hypothetical protein